MIRIGLITEEVEIVLNSNNIKYYEDLGYIIERKNNKYGNLTIPKGTKITVKVYDLSYNSKIKVEVRCDICGKIIKEETGGTSYNNYIKYVKPNKEYFCQRCLRGNGITFEQWCTTNNRLDVIDRWDYDLNKCSPSEITFSNGKKYWFKCPIKLHNSELKSISNFTKGQNGSMNCNFCNSIAQWGIDNICKDFLENYWDYDKNIIDPWSVSKTSNKKIWIRCQEKKYHGSYYIKSNLFSRGYKCPYCASKSVHRLDSVEELYKESKKYFHEDNLTPLFKYSIGSHKVVLWKCHNGIHGNYERSIKSSVRYNFRCPECQNSEGEIAISKWLIKNNIEYVPQKIFAGLVGLKDGLLSYDFYLPEHNLLIEYQGIQHLEPVDFLGIGIEQAEKQLIKQQEHDRRKKQYAEDNNISLLEIWYWDFDNIEFILETAIYKY